MGAEGGGFRTIGWKSGSQSVFDPLLIATGLYSPGAGVGVVAWLATFDGRVPGRAIPWWAFLFNRALWATTHVLPSIAVASLGEGEWWGLPLKTTAYVIAAVVLNYLITPIPISLSTRSSFFT